MTETPIERCRRRIREEYYHLIKQAEEQRQQILAELDESKKTCQYVADSRMRYFCTECGSVL